MASGAFPSQGRQTRRSPRGPAPRPLHERVADILRDLDGPIGDELLGLLRAAFSAGGVKNATKEQRVEAIERLARGSEPAERIRSRRGPDQAAADLLSAVARRSGRYVFLVKQMLAEETDAPATLESEARGRAVPKRELTMYVLKLLGYSRRAVERALQALYGSRTRKR